MDDSLNLFQDQDSDLARRNQMNQREMERKAQDLIRVKNPLTQAFTVFWDGFGHVIPGRDQDTGYGVGQSVLPRYIAMKFAKEITDKILGEKLLQAIKKENEDRVAKGFKPMEKHLAGEEITFSDTLKPSNPNLRKELFSQVIVGLEKEWGMDYTVQATKQTQDSTSPDDDLFNQLANRQIPQTPQEVIAPLPEADFESTEDVLNV